MLAQKGSELHWHPSMISPALLRHAEAWSGGEFLSSNNPSGSAPLMTKHSGHPFVLPEAAEVAASIAAHSSQPAAAGGNAAGQGTGPNQSTSHQPQ